MKNKTKEEYIIEESQKYEGCYNIYNKKTGERVMYFADTNKENNYKCAVQWVKNKTKPDDKLCAYLPSMSEENKTTDKSKQLNSTCQVKEVKADLERDYNLELIRLLEKYVVIPNTDLPNNAVISTILDLINKHIKKNFVAKGEIHNCKKDGCVPIEESVEEVNELGIHKYTVNGSVCKYCGKLV